MTLKIRSIAILFFVLSLVYSLLTPPFEASDEKWHYPLVEYIADRWALPVQTPGVETPWRQEGSQPPLYYFLAALTTAWVDTSDLDTVRHLNPHVDPGPTPDGNINLVVHNPAVERFPWRGTVLAVHLVRFLSVLMSTAAVYLTYRIVAEIFPDRPDLALGAAAVHALTPMYAFISASVNNDNLAVLLCNLALLLIVRMADDRRRVTAGGYLLLGAVLGLAALTKSSALPLTVITALLVAGRALRRRSWREFLIGGAATLGPFLLIAGWWFWRNWTLYGDPSGLNVFIAILGQRDVPADLAQLWRERHSFLAGYWGNFGGLNVPLPAWAYASLDALLLVAAAGLLIRAVRCLRRRTTARIWPLTLLILWGLAVLVSWSRWAAVTWSSQGRLVFSAIQTWSLLLVLGLTAWLPRRWEKWGAAAFAAYLLLLAAAAPFLWIRPAYALPPDLTDAQVQAIPHPVGADFDHLMRLLGYDLGTTTVTPGGDVPVTLYWEALAPADRDYTVFVHLLGAGDLTIAQRDTFPGLGLLSTTWLRPGYRWADRYVLRLPETAYAPDEAQIEVGLYDATTGARLPVGDGDNLRFGHVVVLPLPGDFPNPISVNFGDRMELVGYDLTQRVLRPGDLVTATLYWRGLRRMATDYTVSVQLVDPQQRKAAQHDGWPQGGAAPTTAWEPGEIIVDAHPLTVGDAPPGVYDVQVVVYVQREGEFVHLPVVSSKGEMLFNYRLLTKVRLRR